MIDKRGYIAACAIGIGSSWNIANVGPAADPVAIHYGVAIAIIGLFTTTVFAGEFVSMATIGRLLGRLSAKQVGIGALILCILGNVALLAAGDAVGVALALRLLIGVGVGYGFVCGIVYVQQLGGTALHQGLYGGISLAAGGSAVGIVPLLSGPFEWQAPFVFAAVAGMATLIPAAIGTKIDTLPGGQDTSFLKLLGDRMLIRFALFHSASFGLSIVLSNWIVNLLTGRGDYSASAAGAIGAVILLVGIASRPGGGLLAHLRPDLTRGVLIAMVGAGAVGTLVVGIAPALPIALAATLLIGLASGAPFGPLVAGVGRAFPDSPGAAFGAMNLFALITIMVGTPLLGLTLELPGEGLIGFGAAAAFWVIAGLFLPSKKMLEPTE